MVWNDPAVQELAKKFVAAADEVNVILWQRGKQEAELFRKFSAEGHYKKPWQGIYAATPSGKLLGSTNQRDARVVADMLRSALEKWSALEKKDRLLPEAPSKDAGGQSLYPDGGLVLQVFSRDLPRKDGGETRGFWAGAWNEDYAWFTKDEARSLLPASREPGARQPAPERLARRLAKCHLIDNVRGEAYPFDEADVKRAEMSLVVDRLDGDVVHFLIEGATRAEHGDHGYESKLLGRASYDLKADKFTRFDLVAAGTRWGHRSRTGARQGDLDPAPLGIAFRLAATTDGADRVPPAFVLHPLGKKYFD